MSASSPSPRHWRFDVFPSFRGEDVRQNFLSHLLKEFKSKGIVSYIDENIERSHTIGPDLTRAIRESRISVVILSPNYASSRWCLDELLEIMKCRRETGLIVMPVFYNLDPSHVKNQIEAFGDGFNRACGRETEEEKQIWIEALKQVGEIVGTHSANWESEADMVEQIARDVSKELNATPSRDFDGLIGIDVHMERLISLLRLEKNDVKMVGIWGPPGIGKTTIARALHARLSKYFPLSVFMENVRGNYRTSCRDEYTSKLDLQKQFLSQIFNQKDMVISHSGVIKDRLQSRKVLIILDDVNKLEQLEALTNGPQWFGLGSRIILTTQDKNLLNAHDIDHIYKVNFPSREEALQIFYSKAFKNDSTTQGFMELSIEVVEHVGRLPLGLRVMGSYMRGKSKDRWISELARLKTRLKGEIHEVLRVSYDDLEPNEQVVFLHIACMFNRKGIDYVTQMIGNDELDVGLSLDIMADKSLIDVSTRRQVTMHCLLEQMGREIVQKQSEYEPGKRQFLLNVEEICDVLANETGTRVVLGMSLDLSAITYDVFLSETVFQKMMNLRFLRFYKKGLENRLHFPQGLEYLPRLWSLHWEGYPLKYIPRKFRSECLVELNMTDGRLEKLWEGVQQLGSLKIMNLGWSRELKEIPDLSNATNLERLILNGCTSLVTVPSSIGKLRKLNYLNMSHCWSLESLPSLINLESLTRIVLDGCRRLKTFPEISNKVEDLRLSNTRIEEVASSVKLDNLRDLYMEKADIRGFPDLSQCFPNLEDLILDGCVNLEMLPEFPRSLGYLDARGCHSLKKLSARGFFNPKSVAKLANCVNLDEKSVQNVIQQWRCYYIILSGEKVPPYFDHRSRGGSLTVDLGKMSPSPLLVFKACFVLDDLEDWGYGDVRLACYLKGSDGVIIEKSYEWFFGDCIQFRQNHLCILGYALLHKDDNPAAELPFNHVVLKFNVRFDGSEVEIKGCGVRLFDHNTIPPDEWLFQPYSCKGIHVPASISSGE